MTDISKATARPWKQREAPDDYMIEGANGLIAAEVAGEEGEAEANAALIVCAVNRDRAFDTMNEVLEAAERFRDLFIVDGDPPALINEIEDANAFANAFDKFSQAIASARRASLRLAAPSPHDKEGEQ